jgi:predicted TIM-barrel fold metal-dependent hydrolase
MGYELGLDLKQLVAIDTHVHVEQDLAGRPTMPQVLTDAASAYFHSDHARPNIDEIADTYRERHIAAVVFTVDATTSLGYPPVSSEDIAEGAARNNDVLIPFGSVDPLQGSDAATQARRLVETRGVRGFKFHPTLQNCLLSALRDPPTARVARHLPHGSNRDRGGAPRRIRPQARALEPHAA